MLTNKKNRRSKALFVRLQWSDKVFQPYNRWRHWVQKDISPITFHYKPLKWMLCIFWSWNVESLKICGLIAFSSRNLKIIVILHGKNSISGIWRQLGFKVKMGSVEYLMLWNMLKHWFSFTTKIFDKYSSEHVYFLT